MTDPADINSDDIKAMIQNDLSEIVDYMVEELTEMNPDGVVRLSTFTSADNYKKINEWDAKMEEFNDKYGHFLADGLDCQALVGTIAAKGGSIEIETHGPKTFHRDLGAYSSSATDVGVETAGKTTNNIEQALMKSLQLGDNMTIENVAGELATNITETIKASGLSVADVLKENGMSADGVDEMTVAISGKPEENTQSIAQQELRNTSDQTMTAQAPAQPGVGG